MNAVVDERFEPVARLFADYLEDPAFSGQLSVRWRGQLVVDLAGGRLAHDSLTGVYSISKGLSALVIAQLLASDALELDARVARYWPEFAAQGKDAVTVRELLTHQAGLPLMDGRVPFAEVFVDSRAAAARLAGQLPLWRPGSAFGYHALTIGVLVEELVRRVTGRTLQDVWEHDIRSPRHLDAYLGMPQSLDDRYVPVGEVLLTAEQREEVAARPPGDELSRAVFDNVDAATDLGESGVSANNPAVRRSGQGAIGAVASAHGLAAAYADTLSTATRPIASAAVFASMAQQHSWGTDRVLGGANAFGVLFMVPQPRLPFGGPHAYGHDGAGGALAFADPDTQLAFGYVPHPMQYPGGADFRSVALARAARSCALAAA